MLGRQTFRFPHRPGSLDLSFVLSEQMPEYRNAGSNLKNEEGAQIQDHCAGIVHQSQGSKNAEKQNGETQYQQAGPIGTASRPVSDFCLQFIMQFDLFIFQTLPVPLPVCGRNPVKVFADHHNPREHARTSQPIQNTLQFCFRAQC